MAMLGLLLTGNPAEHEAGRGRVAKFAVKGNAVQLAWSTLAALYHNEGRAAEAAEANDRVRALSAGF